MKGVLTNKIFWIAVAVIVIVLAIYFYGRTTAKDKYQKPIIKDDHPGTTTTDAQGHPWDAAPSAKAIHAAIFDGFLWGAGCDSNAIIDTLSPMTDSMIIQTYNAYNTLYHPKGDGDLISDLNGQWIVPEKSTIMNYFNRVGI
jgi:hypothetical protein